jgi:effector-binding domain-containing protein
LSKHYKLSNCNSPPRRGWGGFLFKSENIPTPAPLRGGENTRFYTLYSFENNKTPIKQWVINKLKTMEIKTLKPMKVLFYSEKTNLNSLLKLVKLKVKELQVEAVSKGMDITGPAYWIYYGADGNPNTEFILEIAIPVYFEGEYKGSFNLKQLPEFKCSTITHYGAWNEMHQSYSKVMGDTLQNNYQLSGVCREAYINVDFIDFSNNITEIQVGII